MKRNTTVATKDNGKKKRQPRREEESDREEEGHDVLTYTLPKDLTSEELVEELELAMQIEQAKRLSLMPQVSTYQYEADSENSAEEDEEEVEYVATTTTTTTPATTTTMMSRASNERYFLPLSSSKQAANNRFKPVDTYDSTESEVSVVSGNEAKTTEAKKKTKQANYALKIMQL